MKKILLCLAALLTVLPIGAGLREPDLVVWGSVIIDRVAVTAADTDVVIEARRTLTGVAIASYRMGSAANAGNYYSLRLLVESGLPLNDETATLVGDSVYLVVKLGSVVKDSKALVVQSRGSIVKVDFGSLDVDTDGLLDDWETRYFGNNSADPNADFDGDGASNLREFLEGTDPTVADAHHPADRNPNDARITINEVTAYGLAWKSNLPWPTGPTNPIPVSFVTRAGALWKGGEAYRLDTNVALTAPMWWTNVALAGLDDAKKAPKAKDGMVSSIRRNLSVTAAGVSAGFLVNLEVEPATAVAAYAVEEKIPEGWAVAEISEGGSLSGDKKMIRWGLYFDATRRGLTYRLTAEAPRLGGALQFDGLGSFDGLDVTTSGYVNLVDSTGALTLTIGHHGAVSVRGLPGQAVALDTSSDLQTWTESAAGTIAADGFARMNTGTTNDAAFYRARTY